MKNKARRSLFVLSLLLLPAISTISACGGNDVGDSFKQLFIPKADLSITDVTSSDPVKGVSILQSYTRSGSTLITTYKFNEPAVTIKNKQGLPRVIFKQMIVQYTVGGTAIPAQRLPILITVPASGTFSGSIPILSTAESLVNSVFPNNTFATSQSAIGEVTLLGVDDNNNLITQKFTTPIRFETDPTNFTDPSASVSPLPSPKAS
ncbi:MAG: hypothetical protein H7263_10470 [Candidatus Sericytochromatia bacterium]|nr:hypothetical protein [Candidatus Sericytochromatia bacterium]